ncbi:MAG: Sbm [Ramlibacter sp.]|nr:Sbm [Ramlibacter sp.]
MSEITGTAAGDPIRLEQVFKRWSEATLAPILKKSPERKPEFLSEANIPIKRLYTPADLAGTDYVEDLGFPGEAPFTRGVYPTMYRTRPWTIRPYAGFGTAQETNQRFKYLLDLNEKALTIAFDLPTQIGYDSDAPQAAGSVGKVGVAIDSIEDMQVLFDGIPIDQASVAMTINATAPVVLAFYLAMAEERGMDLSVLQGTTQNDILKEYVARGTYIFPVRPSLRLTTDLIEYCFHKTPKWNTLSITGVHMREAGATAVQELAFAIAHAIVYIEAALERGLDVDEFAPRLSYSLGCYRDLFEEVAKFRAARRLFARVMKKRFNPKDPRSSMFRIYCGTLGSTLTRQEPENNIVRIAMHALMGALGGTQAIFTAGLDEAFALPTERSARIALRTQQMMVDEFGITNTIDPLGGSYYVESLTNEIERQAMEILDQIDAMGGMIAAHESGWVTRAIDEASYAFQRKVESAEHVYVGMNKYRAEEGAKVDAIETFRVDPDLERNQRERLAALRARRDGPRAAAMLERIDVAARGKENLMPIFIEAAKARVTLGEICGVLRKCWGVHNPMQAY